ncbi:MAG: hypothetical protein NVSMB9_07550 [Isosphaeraceae bacterium]
MPNPQSRGTITLAVVAVALLGTRPVAAQAGPPRGQGDLWNNLVTGTYIEITDQSQAERRITRLEAKRRRDAARGDTVAVENGNRRIARTRFRIGVDEWLIRYNSCQQLGPYPDPICLDPQTYAAIGQYRRPSFGP